MQSIKWDGRQVYGDTPQQTRLRPGRRIKSQNRSKLTRHPSFDPSLRTALTDVVDHRTLIFDAPETTATARFQSSAPGAKRYKDARFVFPFSPLPARSVHGASFGGSIKLIETVR
jgi:hypothetical protein